jgi:alkylated DNA repair dioxygenase AlkB
MSVASFTPSLFGGGEPAPDGSWATVRRLELDERSWVDLAPDWLSGADTWFADLVADAPWDQRRRRMYDQDVMEPRLTCGWRVEEAPAPAPDVAAVLGERYGVRFDRVSANFYRHGDDSVAWHGDRVRFTHVAPLVAIVSLGAPRRFGLRPVGAGPARWLTVVGGDLLVMGGRCQHDWQHTVPKATHGGPRVSMTFRHDDPGPRPVDS